MSTDISLQQVSQHAGHADDHHEHHHHHESFISKYIFSQDHKMIARQFLITGIIWAIIGGLFSVIFRLQLGYPDQSFPFLEDFLGHWAKGGKLQPEFYYALVTMHGTVLVFFVLTAGLSGTFANFLIPLQIGARDMASPMLNMLSYWFFFLASVIMVSSLFVQTGPASGGCTSHLNHPGPPCCAHRAVRPWLHGWRSQCLVCGVAGRVRSAARLASPCALLWCLRAQTDPSPRHRRRWWCRSSSRADFF